MAKLEGLDGLLKALEQAKKRYFETKPPDVVVGYCQAYALYVHEVPANHSGPGRRGKMKYLSDPMRRLHNNGTLKQIVVDTLTRGGKVVQAMLKAAMQIQRVSVDEECPQDTGALKGSSFVCLAYEVDQAAATANARGEAMRATSQGKK